jgi:hypothetical protein
LCAWVLRNDPGITSPILLVPELQAGDFEFIPTKKYLFTNRDFLQQ